MIPEDWISSALITIRMITNKGINRGLMHRHGEGTWLRHGHGHGGINRKIKEQNPHLSNATLKTFLPAQQAQQHRIPLWNKQEKKFKFHPEPREREGKKSSLWFNNNDKSGIIENIFRHGVFRFGALLVGLVGEQATIANGTEEEEEKSFARAFSKQWDMWDVTLQTKLRLG